VLGDLKERQAGSWNPKSFIMSGSRSKYWALCLMSAIFMVGELGHFLIGPVSRPMAQEMQYGDKGCLPISSLSESTTDICKDDMDQAE
jgi:hypothetical protein